MYSEPLVSIVTPCYNGEKYLNRFLDSIVAQTYNRIELIFVNDGSIDDTEKIVFSYKGKLDSKGIILKYIFQENKGLGGAINTGLKMVSGKYLCWPDADDYLEPESVELRLRILEEFPEFAVVTSDAYIRSIDNLEIPIGLASSSYNTNDDPYQFVHLLTGKSIFCSGAHMVRTKGFFETHPSGEIFPSRKGQNWQMLLPVYYKYKRYFLARPLYNYIRHRGGMSLNEAKGFEEKISTYNSQRNIILQTLNTMSLSENERTEFENMVNLKFSSMICKVSYDFGNYELLRLEYCKLKKMNLTSYKLRLRVLLAGLKQIILH